MTKEKISLITGGTGILGVEHAKALLNAGHNVAVTDINREALKLLEKKFSQIYPDNTIVYQVMDVSDEDSIVKVHDKLSIHFHIDVLVNNAAIDAKVSKNGMDYQTRLENFDTSQWNLEMNVGLRGAMLCSKIFGSTMAKFKDGKIINIASDLSVIAPDQRLYHNKKLLSEEQHVKPVTYSVIKHGLIGLTKYCAAYWAKDNVRVNALSPGGVRNGQSDEFMERIQKLIPVGRMADKNEYHGIIRFLASDEAKYLTGQNIIVDGGRTII